MTRHEAYRIQRAILRAATWRDALAMAQTIKPGITGAEMDELARDIDDGRMRRPHWYERGRP